MNGWHIAIETVEDNRNAYKSKRKVQICIFRNWKYKSKEKIRKEIKLKIRICSIETGWWLTI